MTIRAALNNFFRVIVDEAERNPQFARKLESALSSSNRVSKSDKESSRRNVSTGTNRPANRRPPAVINPITIAKRGEQALRDELALLNLDQLKDIVADYGMDKDRLVMKWRTSSRVVDRIVEVSLRRAHKGEAFRQ